MGEMRVKDFDLALTLASGQFFRYRQEGDSYVLITQRRIITIRQAGNRLICSGASAPFIRTLFGIDARHDAQLARLREDPIIAPMLARYPGLRIMRQDLHEAIIGFICSSNSNIPKIRMNLELLARSCGDEIGGVHHLHAPGTPVGEAAARSAKTGYRAKFLASSSGIMTPKMLSAMKRMPYAGAHKALCDLPGVGPKVADCVCLFALGHGEAFPVDVHVLRAMRALFPRARLRDPADAKRFAQQRWGGDAGLAQQYIFQWARDSLPRRRGASAIRPKKRVVRKVTR